MKKLLSQDTRFLFNSLLTLSLFLLLMQCAFLARQLLGYFNENYLLLQVIEKFPWSTVPDIIRYVFNYIILLIFLAVVLTYIAETSGHFLTFSRKNIFRLGIFLWISCHGAIFLTNEIFFPNSAFSTWLKHLLPFWLAIALLMIFQFTLSASATIAVWVSIKESYLRLKAKNILSKNIFITSVILFIVLLLPALWLQQKNDNLYIAPPDRPNIIIIGIDSLRPDKLNRNGNPQLLMPHLENFLQHTVVFRDALTTAGQTFPAWVSILTGQYPMHNGARFDLIAQKYVNKKASIAFDLKKLGYETVLAMDESRFSNIDETYGFDKVIVPPMGASEFLLGTFADIPLINLISTKAIGGWLFSFNYANRAAIITYEPKQFDKKLEQFLQQPRTKPLFLAVHFCLPHWPYLWRKQTTSPIPPDSPEKIKQLYEQSLTVTDAQFERFIKSLRRHKLLTNTWVIVLSDHGEALLLPLDRITTEAQYRGSAIVNSPLLKIITTRFYPRVLNSTFGHGNDVLSLTQSHVLLGFRYYGNYFPAISKEETFPTSLVDIKITLLDLLNQPLKQTLLDGASLKNMLLTQTVSKPNSSRFRILESAYWPDFAEDTENFSLKEILRKSIVRYLTDTKTNRVYVDDKNMSAIIDKKQRAIYQDDWILALYPNDGHKIPVIVNLKTGEWIDDFSAPFAQNSPENLMLLELKKSYPGEL